jgi:tRNA pseudouridine32 synthase/23S rRNA pseudouridine746 synthase
MATRQPIPILLETGDFLVVDKPAGMPVTRGRKGGPSVEGVLARSLASGREPPRAVHRLDQDTSGCLLLARRARALRGLGRAFAEGTVEKLYLAVISPGPQQPEGLIAAPLEKISSPGKGWRMIVAEGGKPARTRWRCLARQGEEALLAFFPETGRTHQLRVHAQLLAPGAAIIGDTVYGHPGREGLLLHAACLRFPWQEKRWSAAAPFPARFPTWARAALPDQLEGLLAASDWIMADAIRSGSSL